MDLHAASSRWSEARFGLAVLLPAAVATGVMAGPWAALFAAFGFQALVALSERVPALADSPKPVAHEPWHSAVIRAHVLWQAGLLALGLHAAMQPGVGWFGILLLGVAVGSVCGSQGITFAHELGHSRSRLETITYIEHYGLVREASPEGKPEHFGQQHAWNADHFVFNALIANLQRHSDHHMHPWKPYAELEALPGPQLPGYAGCIALATVPRWWFNVMDRRLAALSASA